MWSVSGSRVDLLIVAHGMRAGRRMCIHGCDGWACRRACALADHAILSSPPSTSSTKPASEAYTAACEYNACVVCVRSTSLHFTSWWALSPSPWGRVTGLPSPFGTPHRHTHSSSPLIGWVGHASRKLNLCNGCQWSRKLYLCNGCQLCNGWRSPAISGDHRPRRLNLDVRKPSTDLPQSQGTIVPGD